MRCASLILSVLLLVGLSLPSAAAESTLARLSFWVPPERMAEFGRVYQDQLAPILQERGFAPAEETGRATVDSVFSRLFAFATPTARLEAYLGLQRDPAWSAAMARLGPVFAPASSPAPLRYYLKPYAGSVSPTVGVLAGAGRRQGPWLSFGVEDGLTSMVITDIAQDRSGHLWFGTWANRIARFDGERFTLPIDSGMGPMERIFIDRSGRLWMYGRTRGGGLTRYDGQGFAHFFREDGRGLDEVTALLEDRSGHLWILAGDGLTRYDGADFVTVTYKDSLAANPTRLLEDRAGRLWILTRNGRAMRYDGADFVTVAQEECLAGHNVTAFLEDRAGYWWIGTRDGLIRFDGARFATFTREQGLADNNVQALYEDRAGYLWVGTWGGGVSRFEGSQLTNFGATYRAKNAPVWAIAEDHAGQIWLGTQTGVSRYRDGTFVPLEGAPQEKAETLLVDRAGHVWIGYLGGTGLARYDGQAHKVFDPQQDGLPRFDNMRALMEDRAGHLWVGSANGAYRFDGQRFVSFTAAQGLTDVQVSAVLEDRQGHLWFSTEEGLFHYDGDVFTQFTTADGLGGNKVSSLLEDRSGRLWVGTWDGTGLSSYDGRGFIRFTSEDGLTYAKALALMEDDQGHLWIGTWGGGVFRYDGRVFQQFNERHGLVNDAVKGLVQDGDGAIWIATEGGVTRYWPRPSTPSVHIEQIVADRTYDGTKALRLPHTQRHISVAFQGGSFLTSWEQLVYRYRLVGHQDWRQTRQRQVAYADLPVGAYTFEV